ncbi:hypothetical protein ACRE_074900 [Hapsidospora chrysogenum ATCC 11550]|uniref:Uncharacterized protein n=1 Tax=Hapsidospora chrysogenum (strain ATCC 11550 / CBS 779.69 / DSM 880 / IAM 14645 / JCM 23072 / IMI 49137) TaxID=857340 RepID=A0A086SXH2_HAPC1|nr:hypothetical protein ACRE_074900 [Hapsidospora chrysogenum ATCC 11550]
MDLSEVWWRPPAGRTTLITDNSRNGNESWHWSLSTGGGTPGKETGCDGDSRDEADTVPVREDATALIVSAKVVE